MRLGRPWRSRMLAWCTSGGSSRRRPTSTRPGLHGPVDEPGQRGRVHPAARRERRLRQRLAVGRNRLRHQQVIGVYQDRLLFDRTIRGDGQLPDRRFPDLGRGQRPVLMALDLTQAQSSSVSGDSTVFTARPMGMPSFAPSRVKLAIGALFRLSAFQRIRRIAGCRTSSPHRSASSTATRCSGSAGSAEVGRAGPVQLPGDVPRSGELATVDRERRDGVRREPKKRSARPARSPA